MKILARALAFVAVVVWVFGAAATVQAKGKGGGGRTAAGQQKAGPQSGHHQVGQVGVRAGSRDRQMLRIQLPDQQRDRYMDCAAAAASIRRQARGLAQVAKGSGFNAATARGQRDQLREHVGSMFQDHDRFMSKFGENAQMTLRDRRRQLEQDRERIHAHLQAVDHQLERNDPDRQRFRAEARKVKKAIGAWQKHYRQLGYDLGVTAG